MTYKKNFECNFCGKSFTTERGYIKHTCKKHKRYKNHNTLEGQMAYSYYQLWFELQKKKVPDVIAFIGSNFYLSFMRFAEFVKSAELSHPDMFIRFMVDNKNTPTIWTNNIMYSKYLEYLDKGVDPMKQLKTTLEELSKISEEKECDISDIFNNIETNRIIDLIKKRRISPWVLLQSKKFMTMLKGLQEKEHSKFMIFLSLINPPYWSKRFKDNPKKLKTTEQILNKLNL